MINDKIVVMLWDEEKEKKIRAKILNLLNRKIKGIANAETMSELIECSKTEEFRARCHGVCLRYK